MEVWNFFCRILCGYQCVMPESWRYSWCGELFNDSIRDKYHLDVAFIIFKGLKIWKIIQRMAIMSYNFFVFFQWFELLQNQCILHFILRTFLERKVKEIVLTSEFKEMWLPPPTSEISRFSFVGWQNIFHFWCFVAYF